MIKKIVMGIDPGLINTGWCILEKDGNKISYIADGTVKTKTGERMDLRLSEIYTKISEIIKKHQPESIAIEESFVNKNPQTSLKLGMARASSILAGANQKTPVYEYQPTLIKKCVVGVGRADKNQINQMIKILISGNFIPDSEHSADAMAIAITHSNLYGSKLCIK